MTMLTRPKSGDSGQAIAVQNPVMTNARGKSRKPWREIISGTPLATRITLLQPLCNEAAASLRDHPNLRCNTCDRAGRIAASRMRLGDRKNFIGCGPHVTAGLSPMTHY